MDSVWEQDPEEFLDIERWLQNITNSPTIDFNGSFAPTLAPTEVEDFISISLPTGFLDLNLFLLTMYGYLVGFQIIAILIILWWVVYPLPSDERASFPTLMFSIWSTFILVGDYVSDVLVTLAILFGELEISLSQQTFDGELFTRLSVILSGLCLLLAIVAMAWIGKEDRFLDSYSFLFRLLLVATGVYPLKLLIELVTANYYGGQRAKLRDIVRLKYIQGTVEGVPQIGFLIYLNLLQFDGLAELVGISLCFSVVSLVSGLVMWDYVREKEKDEFIIREGMNDVNYLFFSPYLANIDHNKENANCPLFDWAFHSVITRILECLGRLSFYATFAIVTNGWGVSVLIFVDVVMLLRYHRFVFFFYAWLELVFNLRDEGNKYIAYGEWKWKFITTVIGYIVIVVRLSNVPALIEVSSTTPEQFIFYLGLGANLVLYPWIIYMFRRQRQLTSRAENWELEEALEEAKYEGDRTFDKPQAAPTSYWAYYNPLNYFRSNSY